VPIRTHRGRAAVYRTFWGWPVRSPKHLAGTVLAFAALSAGLALALPEKQKVPAVAAPSSTARVNPFDPASRAAVPGPRPPAATTPSTPPAGGAAAPAAALTVADTWTKAFLSAPDRADATQWIEQLRPYTTEETLPLLESIDLDNVPEGEVTGQPRTVSSGAGKAEVDVPTTAGVMRLLLVLTPAGWRVADFDRVG